MWSLLPDSKQAFFPREENQYQSPHMYKLAEDTLEYEGEEKAEIVGLIFTVLKKS